MYIPVYAWHRMHLENTFSFKRWELGIIMSGAVHDAYSQKWSGLNQTRTQQPQIPLPYTVPTLMVLIIYWQATFHDEYE